MEPQRNLGGRPRRTTLLPVGFVQPPIDHSPFTVCQGCPVAEENCEVNPNGSRTCIFRTLIESRGYYVTPIGREVKGEKISAWEEHPITK